MSTEAANSDACSFSGKAGIFVSVPFFFAAHVGSDWVKRKAPRGRAFQRVSQVGKGRNHSTNWDT